MSRCWIWRPDYHPLMGLVLPTHHQVLVRAGVLLALELFWGLQFLLQGPLAALRAGIYRDTGTKCHIRKWAPHDSALYFIDADELTFEGSPASIASLPTVAAASTVPLNLSSH